MAAAMPMKLRTVLVAFGLAVALTAAHLALVLAFSGQSTWSEAYSKLHRWDSAWFEDIAKEGYRCPANITRENPGNVAFLPGFPCLVWLTQKATGLDWPYPVEVAAQLASIGVWFYLVLLLADFGLPKPWIGLTVILLICHPAAFFLVLGYSESLFVASMLGYIFWSRRDSRIAVVLACLHGLVMCATRLVGLAVAVYPLVDRYCTDSLFREQIQRLHLRMLFRPLSLFLCSCLGLALFFGHCWWRFGQWDLYFRVEELGWEVVPEYLAFFYRRTYLIGPRLSLPDLYLEPDNLSRQCVPMMLLLAGWLAFLEYRSAQSGSTEWRGRVALYLAAALMLFINVTGRSSLRQSGMVRYAFVIEMLLLLAAVPLFLQREVFSRMPSWRRLTVYCLVVILSLWGQIAYIYRFVARGEWVA